MDISLSNMTWCPPWYVSWSMLGMLVLPVVVFPILRSRSLSVSAVPMLIGLTPLFHGCLLAYLGVRSVFIGLTVAGTESPVVLSAGFGEAHRVLAFAAVISGIVLTLAIGIALHRRPSSFAPVSMFAAQRGVTAITISGVVLLLGVFAITFAAMNSARELLRGLYYASLVGAWLAGALVLTTLSTAWVAGRASRNGESSANAAVRSLVVALAIVVATGAASWFARAWLIRIATTGG
jgi:hypothetical protein